MAERTPFRSILSLVPSKSESDEMATKASDAQRARQRRSPLSRVSPTGGQMGQQYWEPAEQSQSQDYRVTVRPPSGDPLMRDRSDRQIGAATQARSPLSPGAIARFTPAVGSVEFARPLPPGDAYGGVQTKPSPVGRTLRSLATERPANTEMSRRGKSRDSSTKSDPSPKNRQPSRDKGSSLSNRSESRGKRTLDKGDSSVFPPAPKQRNRTAERRGGRSTSPLVYVARLLILGVGLGVIAGTLLSVWDPSRHYTAGAASSKPEQQGEAILPSTAPIAIPPTLQLSKEIAPLKTQLKAMAGQNSDLTPGVFIFDVESGAYLDLNGNSPLPAASTIKVPVLIAFFQDVDAGKIRLDERLTMKREHIAEGSGEMQFQPAGTKYTALEVATKMITISDNTATNMLISRLGGMAALNERFVSWGLTATAINNPLPDLEGTNTTSPKDLVHVMGILEQGNLVSIRSRDRVLAIMRQTVNDSLLPQGLGEGATIAHKTGDIGSLIADVGLVDMPSGKRYIAGIMVKRPHNDARAEDLVRQISAATYKSFNRERSKQ